jgi:hypothetical protein
MIIIGLVCVPGILTGMIGAIICSLRKKKLNDEAE